MNRVLVTGVGSPAGIAVLKSLAGTSATVFAADVDPHAAGLYMVARERRLIIPPAESEDFADTLVDLCTAAEIEIVVPTAKNELLPLARRRARFIAAGIYPVMAVEETLRLAWDRSSLYERVSGTVHMPKTVLVDESFDPSEITLPAEVAPRHVADERRSLPVKDRAALEALPRDGSVVVTEMLRGSVYSLDVLSGADRRVVAVVPQAQLRVDGGLAIATRTIHDERLETLGRAAAEAISLTSVATMRVKLGADGVPALVGIDPLFSTTTSLTVASGADLPRLAVGEAAGRPLPDRMVAFRDVTMVRYLEERFFAYEEVELLQRSAAHSASNVREHRAPAPAAAAAA